MGLCPYIWAFLNSYPHCILNFNFRWTFGCKIRGSFRRQFLLLLFRRRGWTREVHGSWSEKRFLGLEERTVIRSGNLWIPREIVQRRYWSVFGKPILRLHRGSEYHTPEIRTLKTKLFLTRCHFEQYSNIVQWYGWGRPIRPKPNNRINKNQRTE